MEAAPTLSRPGLGIRISLKHPVDQLFISAYGAIDAKRFNKGVIKPLTRPQGAESSEQGSSQRIGGDFGSEPHSRLSAEQVHDAS